MSTRTIEITERLQGYFSSTIHEPPVLAQLREETSRQPLAIMQISPEQGNFMRFLAETLGVKRALEIGVFTGYSAISVALALPAGGKLVACDVSEEYAAIARRYFELAAVASKIDLRIRPAAETLDALLAAGDAGSYDFAFIDADKTNYDVYYERALALLRVGGVIAVDNVLWGGAVADPGNHEPSTVAIRELNRKIVQDPRVTCSLVPIGDGVMLARKRE
jgi:caffeoyl-CoA O-methyltransferase